MKGELVMNTDPIHAKGSNENIEEVIKIYTKMVYGIALTHVRNQSDADDVFQETFLIYFKKNKTFNDEEHRKAWLINTTINCCKKIIGSTWNKKKLPLEILEGSIYQFSSKDENSVYTTLCTLPEKYRIVLHLFYFEDMTIDEISKILKIKAGTIRMQLTRGREMVRKKLKGDYFDE